MKSANPTRYTQESSIEHQESRIAQTAHLANPAPYTQESSIKHRKSGCLWPTRHSTSVENPLQIHPFLYKRTQSPKCPKSPQPQSPQRITKIMALPHDPKTNPNEPKANPIFRPSGAPKAKTNPNEPKTKPIPQKPKNQPNLSHRKGLRQ